MRGKLYNTTTNDWIYKACGEVSRFEAFFSGLAYAPHRHDTYTLGITLDGVQSFDYMGSTRHSLPGGLVVLHPDELHDGRAGTEDGFRYRAINIEPSLMQSALGGRALPFIQGGISSDQRLLDVITPLLGDLKHPLEMLEYQDAIYDLAIILDEVGGADKPDVRPNYEAAELARQYILERLDRGITMEDLESLTGHDRWQLSRDFRALFGTSPYRYLIMRRLDKAQKLIREGHSIAAAAIASEFSDQSHLTRHFKKAYGVTPKKWALALGDTVRN